ncbi:HEPN domain-containing protein [Sphingobacterium paucimobilis]|uniref:HEPN domain-containing protein n=1 Tax=Sphingobacterium paucimobilis HER1398 TaxID=1346330 RepID=U2HXE7_9SPHI|nr:HEPN domain-containing protein [Sphingobacterium paucimobilis]ERJ60217.1 hypothetical protein M472_15770 [Sphingobacterium paucimobilis HER1398]
MSHQSVVYKYVKTLGDLVPKIVNTIKEYPQYKVICYVAFQAKDKIREGNLFLFTSCQPQKLIYTKENSEFVPIPENFDFTKCKGLAIDLKNREQQKIDEFKEGYYHFSEKGKYSLASFMLHQAIELTYRYLELLLIAKERVTHSIRCHHLYMKEIISIYANVFDEDDHDDIVLLQVLEDIYRSTRYEDHFEVAPEMVKRLEEKMEALHKNGVQIFEHIISSFEKDHHLINQEHCLPREITVSKLDDNAYLEDAVEQLKRSISEPIAVYLFGHRARSFFIEGINERETTGICDYYFDLLIVSETDIREQLSSLQPFINERIGISLFLLSFTKVQIQKELDKNSPFFHQVLCENEALLHAGLEVSDWHFHESKGMRTKQEVETARTKWYQRKDNANGFLHGGNAIDNSEEVVIKVLLYNQAMEQACLGLLEFFYGYTPYQHNLHHLYNLCCSFWYFPNDIFPRATEEDKRLFKEFVHVVKNVRYKGLSYIDWDEAYRYEARCERFLEECIKLVQGTFSNE